MTVNRERVQLWVDALRSGEFRQGRDHLRNADGTMCCLGVACVVAIRGGCEVAEEVRDPSPSRFAATADPDNDGSTSYAPDVVRRWFGFDLAEPRGLVLYDEGNNYVTAVSANDSHGWSFERIADAVEARYLAPETADTAPTT